MQTAGIGAKIFAQVNGTHFRGETNHSLQLKTERSPEKVGGLVNNDERARDLLDEFKMVEQIFLDHAGTSADADPTPNQVTLKNQGLHVTRALAAAANPGIIPAMVSFFKGPDSIALATQHVSGTATLTTNSAGKPEIESLTAGDFNTSYIIAKNDNGEVTMKRESNSAVGWSLRKYESDQLTLGKDGILHHQGTRETRRVY